MKRNFMFTSESVTEGHPDKLCDQISDAIVDRLLEHDPFSRVAAECAMASGVLFIAAHIASETAADLPETAREVIRQAGYATGEFNAKDCAIMTSIANLPQDSRQRVDERELDHDDIDRIPARHQVTVFGHACSQTPALIPLPIWLAHQLARGLDNARKNGPLDYLLPDGATQVGIEFLDRHPQRLHSISLTASQTKDGPDPRRLRADLQQYVIDPVLARESLRPDEQTRIFINPEGPLIGGGPSAHAGLTGRKTAIDTYGSFARHSGSALSGKDPMRIDRIGAYAARYAAKNIVAAGLADECEVQLSYSIGQVQPVSIQVETYGTGSVGDDELARRLYETFDFRPAGIIRDLDLRHQPARRENGFYRALASYGHMGRTDLAPPWESTDRAAMLK
ncbi:MAG: methionine adenosyltransferase [Pseudomonadota bacterium]